MNPYHDNKGRFSSEEDAVVETVAKNIEQDIRRVYKQFGEGTEALYAVNDKGEVVFKRTGKPGARSVDLSDVLDKLKGLHLIHNHPSGDMTLSDADTELAIASGAKSIVAVGKKFSFRLRVPEQVQNLDERVRKSHSMYFGQAYRRKIALHHKHFYGEYEQRKKAGMSEQTAEHVVGRTHFELALREAMPEFEKEGYRYERRRRKK